MLKTEYAREIVNDPQSLGKGAESVGILKTNCDHPNGSVAEVTQNT